MEKIPTEIEDCYIIKPNFFGDQRGYYSPFFVETDNIGFKTIAQGARSLSGKGILRGMHFQEDPLCQAKLVECLSGEVLDVVVDLRKDSKTYKKYIKVHLTPENKLQLFIPRGCAHGFLSLKDNTLFQYLVDNDYAPSHENGIAWDDKEINIDWEFEKYGIDEPILSAKDSNRLSLKDNNINFYKHKKYLITGVSGQLGYDIVKELNKRGIYDILALSSKDLDITNERLVKKIITEYAPEHIIHCAAYTKVDQAEKEQEKCYDVNVLGTKYITEAARMVSAKLTYISTDYVFDGTKNSLYEVTDEVNPVNYYGKTKYLGEEIVRGYDKHFIVRISWVFGINGKNFLKTMLNLSKTKDSVNVVNDQVGSPTYTKDLAKLLIDMQNTAKYGTYHATNEGFISWAELASFIYRINDIDTKVNPILTKDYQTLASRPLNSRLSKKSLTENGFNLLPEWESAVVRYNDELIKEQDILKRELK